MSHRLLGPLTDFRFFCPQCASRRIAENSLASKIHFNINVWSAEPASADRMIANVEFPNVDKGFLLFHGSTNFRESTSCQQTSAPIAGQEGTHLGPMFWQYISHFGNQTSPQVPVRAALTISAHGLNRA